jgi:hypothetical protein
MLRLFLDHTTGGRRNSIWPITCSRRGARHKGCLSSLNSLPSHPPTWPPAPHPPHPSPAPREFHTLISSTQWHLSMQVCVRSHTPLFPAQPPNFADITLSWMTAAVAAIFGPSSCSRSAPITLYSPPPFPHPPYNQISKLTTLDTHWRFMKLSK